MFRKKWEPLRIGGSMREDVAITHGKNKWNQ